MSVILTSSLRVSCIFLLLLCTHHFFRLRVPAKFLHAGWVLAALSSILPLGISLSWAPYDAAASYIASPLSERLWHRSEARERLKQDSLAVEEASDLRTSAATDVSPAPATQSVLSSPYLGIGWAAVTCALLVVRFVASLSFRRHFLRTGQPAGRILTNTVGSCLAELGIDRKVPVLVSDAVGTPSIMGVFRPFLVFPSCFEDKFSPSELRWMTLHELGHLQRRDLFSQALIHLACSLHWFNPLFWICARLAREDCELACDQWVMRQGTVQEEDSYGNTLLKVLKTQLSPQLPIPPGLGIFNNPTGIKTRLIMIARNPPPTRVRSGLGLTLLLLIAFASFTRGTPSELQAEAKDPNPQNFTSVLEQKRSEPQPRATPALVWVAPHSGEPIMGLVAKETIDVSVSAESGQILYKGMLPSGNIRHIPRRGQLDVFTEHPEALEIEISAKRFSLRDPQMTTFWKKVSVKAPSIAELTPGNTPQRIVPQVGFIVNEPLVISVWNDKGERIYRGTVLPETPVFIPRNGLLRVMADDNAKLRVEVDGKRFLPPGEGEFMIAAPRV